MKMFTMNVNYLFVPLFCVPMLYQSWLLFVEYQHGLTSAISYDVSLAQDLPAITVCLPFKHLFSLPQRDALIYSVTDPENWCYEMRHINQSSGMDWLTRSMCYKRAFMDWVKIDDVLGRNLTIKLDDFSVLYVSITQDVNGEQWQTALLQPKPNLVSYTPHHGKCWTYFSRSTRDWHTARHDAKTGEIKSSSGNDWPYKLRHVKGLYLQINTFNLLRHFYLTQK